MATIVVRSDTPLPVREPNDVYITPPDFVAHGLRIVERVVADPRLEGPRSCFMARDPIGWNPRILDPGAGEGLWGSGARMIWTPREIVGVEIRDVPRPGEYDRWVLGDFLTAEDSLIGRDFDLVIGNYPYKHAETFVRRGLELLAPGGVMCALFYLTFLESERRGSGLFAEFPPFLVSVAKKRPQFTGKANPNAACFMTFVKSWKGDTKLEWV